MAFFLLPFCYFLLCRESLLTNELAWFRQRYQEFLRARVGGLVGGNSKQLHWEGGFESDFVFCFEFCFCQDRLALCSFSLCWEYCWEG